MFQVYNIVIEIYIPYDTIITISLVTVCHHTDIIIVTVFSVLYITSLRLIFFIRGGLYFVFPFTLFTHLSRPIPSGNHQFVLCIAVVVENLLEVLPLSMPPNLKLVVLSLQWVCNFCGECLTYKLFKYVMKCLWIPLFFNIL